MKTCVNCGNIENSNNAVSCSVCGGMLRTAESLCSVCGTPIEKGVAFCPKCGSNTAGDGDVAYPPTYAASPRYYEPNRREAMPSSYSRGNKTLVASVVAACVLLVSCVSVVAYLLISSSQDKSETAATNEIQESGVQGNPSGNGTTEIVPESPKESRYEVIKADIPWYTAYVNAKNMGGHLVYINDYAEFVKVCAMAEQKNIKVFWMGAFVDYPSTDWTGVPWMNGAPMTYTKWLPGEPSGEDTDKSPEKYLMAFYVKKYGDWFFNDAQNDVSSVHKGKIGYIVEFEP